MQERKETLWIQKFMEKTSYGDCRWESIACEPTGKWMLDEYDNLFLEVKYMLPVYERIPFIERFKDLFYGPYWKKVGYEEVISYECEGILEFRKDKVYFTCGETE